MEEKKYCTLEVNKYNNLSFVKFIKIALLDIFCPLYIWNVMVERGDGLILRIAVIARSQEDGERILLEPLLSELGIDLGFDSDDQKYKIVRVFDWNCKVGIIDRGCLHE